MATYTVAGTVTEDDDVTPIEGTRVRLVDVDTSFLDEDVTDASGDYSLEQEWEAADLPRTVTIRFSALGYAYHEEEVEVTESPTSYDVDASLEEGDGLPVVHVDGVEVAYRDTSLDIEERLNACDQATFEVALRAGDTSVGVVGQPVDIWRTDARYDKLFGGSINSIEEIDHDGAEDYTRYERFECVCHSALAERYYVAESYENMDAGAIATDLVETYLADEGVTTNNVEDGLTIDAANFNWVRLSEALNELAELTAFAWWIDEHKDLHFVDRTAHAAPFAITDGNRPYRSMRIRHAKRRYRNRQIIRAGKDLTDERTETFVGDGSRKTFNLAFPVGEVPTIEVNDVVQSVGIRGVDSGDDWYWNKESERITQDDGATALTDSDTLEVTYRGLFPVIVRAEDGEEIEARQAIEGGAGIYEAIESEPNINDQALALDRALGLLRRFAHIETRIRFETDEARLRRGQLLSISLTPQGLDADFLVDSVRWTLLGNNRLRQTVDCVSGESFGGWTEYFRKLQRQGRDFVIRENEVLVLLRTTFDAVAMTDDVTTEEDDPTFIIGTDEIGFAEIG